MDATAGTVIDLSESELASIKVAAFTLATAFMLTSEAGDADATMPTLTDKPETLDLTACGTWAKRQDADVIDMWGIQEDGASSHDLGIHRLVSECLGDGTPDIVYSQSSAGAHEDFCDKHPKIGLCQRRDEPASSLDYRGAWTEDPQGCPDKVHAEGLAPNQYIFGDGMRLNFEGACRIEKTARVGLSSWEFDEVCQSRGSRSRSRARWSLSVAGNSMVALIRRAGSRPSAPFNLVRCKLAR